MEYKGTRAPATGKVEANNATPKGTQKVAPNEAVKGKKDMKVGKGGGAPAHMSELKKHGLY